MEDDEDYRDNVGQYNPYIDEDKDADEDSDEDDDEYEAVADAFVEFLDASEFDELVDESDL